MPSLRQDLNASVRREGASDEYPGEPRHIPENNDVLAKCPGSIICTSGQCGADQTDGEALTPFSWTLRSSTPALVRRRNNRDGARYWRRTHVPMRGNLGGLHG